MIFFHWFLMCKRNVYNRWAKCSSSSIHQMSLSTAALVGVVVAGVFLLLILIMAFACLLCRSSSSTDSRKSLAKLRRLCRNVTGRQEINGSKKNVPNNAPGSPPTYADTVGYSNHAFLNSTIFDDKWDTQNPSSCNTSFASASSRINDKVNGNVIVNTNVNTTHHYSNGGANHKNNDNGHHCRHDGNEQNIHFVSRNYNLGQSLESLNVIGREGVIIRSKSAEPVKLRNSILEQEGLGEDETIIVLNPGPERYIGDEGDEGGFLVAQTRSARKLNLLDEEASPTHICTLPRSWSDQYGGRTRPRIPTRSDSSYHTYHYSTPVSSPITTLQKGLPNDYRSTGLPAGLPPLPKLRRSESSPSTQGLVREDFSKRPPLIISPFKEITRTSPPVPSAQAGRNIASPAAGAKRTLEFKQPTKSVRPHSSDCSRFQFSSTIQNFPPTSSHFASSQDFDVCPRSSPPPLPERNYRSFGSTPPPHEPSQTMHLLNTEQNRSPIVKTPTKEFEQSHHSPPHSTPQNRYVAVHSSTKPSHMSNVRSAEQNRSPSALSPTRGYKSAVPPSHANQNTSPLESRTPVDKFRWSPGASTPRVKDSPPHLSPPHARVPAAESPPHARVPEGGSPPHARVPTGGSHPHVKDHIISPVTHHEKVPSHTADSTYRRRTRTPPPKPPRTHRYTCGDNWLGVFGQAEFPYNSLEGTSSAWDLSHGAPLSGKTSLSTLGDGRLSVSHLALHTVQVSASVDHLDRLQPEYANFRSLGRHHHSPGVPQNLLLGQTKTDSKTFNSDHPLLNYGGSSYELSGSCHPFLEQGRSKVATNRSSEKYGWLSYNDVTSDPFSQRGVSFPELERFYLQTETFIWDYEPIWLYRWVCCHID